MSLVFSCLAPHPPIIVLEVGGRETHKVKNTIAALQGLEGELYASKPDTIIVISPHSIIIPEAFNINLANYYRGDLSQFGAPQVSLKFQGDMNLAYKIKESAETSLPLVLTNNLELDHGILVPFYFLTPHLPKVKIIPMSFCFKSLEQHFQFGQAIKEQIQKTNQRVAVIASGDLSHCLTAEAPGGYSPRGKEFDEKLVKLLKEKKVKEILSLEPELIEEAGECGLRSLVILLGILDHIQYQPEVLSYEGPFGVGYLVANFKLN